MKKPVANPILQTWINLNDAILEASEEECQKLLKEEMTGRRRKMFVRRIHSRLNRLRGQRERKEMNKKMGFDEAQ